MQNRMKLVHPSIIVYLSSPPWYRQHNCNAKALDYLLLHAVETAIEAIDDNRSRKANEGGQPQGDKHNHPSTVRRRRRQGRRRYTRNSYGLLTWGGPAVRSCSRSERYDK